MYQQKIKAGIGSFFNPTKKTGIFGGKLGPNIRRGNAENRAILETLRNIQQNVKLRNAQLRQSATYDEYMDRINGIVDGPFNYPSAGNLEREDLTDEQIAEQAKIFYNLYPQFSPKQ